MPLTADFVVTIVGVAGLCTAYICLCWRALTHHWIGGSDGHPKGSGLMSIILLCWEGVERGWGITNMDNGTGIKLVRNYSFDPVRQEQPLDILS